MIRVGNCSGFYGDRFSAMREMLTGGPLDYLTGDYLAELTMLILGRDRIRDPAAGYARTFLRQLQDCFDLARDNGVRLVSNAGGLNPAGLAERIRSCWPQAKVAYVDGDDLLPRAGELRLGDVLTANAYLGAWGIAAALQAGADIVVTGRVTDASLALGPAVAHYGWSRTDYDRLAGAVVAGHVIECGAQATGGNYSFFTDLDVDRPGFPIAEISEDGSATITKHPGTGGAVTVGTVTAQLLYEIGAARYAGPDVTARFDTAELTQDGPDRVRITSVKGEPPPPTVKVATTRLGGFRNEMTFVLTGLDIEAKAALVRRQLVLAEQPADLVWTLARTDRPDAAEQEQASALLHCVVRDPDPAVVGRAFSGAGIELALSSYPGFSVTAPPGDASPYGVYTAAYVDAAVPRHAAVLPDGTRLPIAPPAHSRPLQPVAEPAVPRPGTPAATRDVPLGTVAGARSGDKGGDANIGVWAARADSWPWLAEFLTVERLKDLLPETRPLPVTRHLLPNLRALNFVVEGLLGRGVAENARFDPQGKGLGEWLRARVVPVPEALL